MKPKTLASVSALAAFSAVTQLLHIGYQSPQWGMWIDLVAVSWFIAYFLLGFKPALTVVFVSGIIISLFAPDTILGAVMKTTATLPVLITLALTGKFSGRGNPDYFRYPFNLLIPVLIGLLLRSAIIIPLNYNFAIPLWTGLSVSDAMRLIPWYIIAGFNTVQGILELILAWIIVYRFKFIRYATFSS